MNEILRFYLETILPTAVQKNHSHSKTPIDSIGSIFQDLKRDMVKCVSPSFGPYEISLKDDLRERIDLTDIITFTFRVNLSVPVTNTAKANHNPNP